MIDIHSHILPAMDDGSRSIEESLQMARMAVESGVKAVTATPHCVDDRDGRKQVIYDTYRNAVNAGDSNVYFIDGSRIFSEYGYDATVDGAHPNELGFYAIARTVGDVIEEILEK